MSKIDYLAVGVGPGSFTGLRIGIGVAQALAYTHSLPILAISSLEMLAVSAVSLDEFDYESGDENIMLVAHDARMSEIYSVAYELNLDNRFTAKSDIELLKPEQMTLPEVTQSPLYICGNAWQEYVDKLTHLDLRRVKKRETKVAAAGKVVEYIDVYLEEFKPVSWQELQPIYVRNDVAKKSSKKTFL